MNRGHMGVYYQGIADQGVEHLQIDNEGPPFWFRFGFAFGLILSVFAGIFALVSGIIKIVLTIFGWPFGFRRVSWKAAGMVTVSMIIGVVGIFSPIAQTKKVFTEWWERDRQNYMEERYQDHRV